MRRISRLILGALLAVGLTTAVLAQTPAPAAGDKAAEGKAAPAAADKAAQPPAAPAGGSDLFPLKAGSKWKYKLGDAQEVEIRVEANNPDGSTTLATYVQTRKVATEGVQVKADGVYRTKVNESAVTPPIKILSLPAKKDASWTIDSKVQDQPLTGKYTIKDEKEKIKTKDGKEYEAVVVDAPDLMVAGTKTNVKTWYSPGKGIVKLSYTINQYEATIELLEYTEGK